MPPHSPTVPPVRPEELAFLRAIKEQPDDDAPRLIFADWLYEQGDPRGEFLRVQCVLARMDEDDPRRAGLTRREEELLRQHKVAWASQLGVSGRHCQFERGLMRVKVSSQYVWNRLAGPKLDEAAAWLAGLIVSGYTSGSELVPRVTKSALLRHLNSLFLVDMGISEAVVAALAASPHLKSLTLLGLEDNDLDDTEAAALADSPFLARLTSLDLAVNDIGDEGAAALAASPHLRELTQLDLRKNSISDEGAAALAASRRLAHLTFLRLAMNPIGEQGAAALAASPYLVCLTSLDLRSTGIGEEGKRALRNRFGNRVKL